MDTLVIEIGTEELPSSCIQEGMKEFKNIIDKKLKKNRIKISRVNTFGSPRRLSAIVDGVADMQKSEERIVTGPPKKIAYDNDGNPNKTATGFAKSLGLDPKDLEEIKTPKGIYMGKTILEEGKPSLDILPDILRDSILSLSFSKQMRWDNLDITFARPIRWVMAILGSKTIKFDLANIKSGKVTFGHRMLSDSPLQIKDAENYMDILESEGKVIVDPEKRKDIIIKSIKEIEKNEWNSKLKVVLDQDLLEEVVNLVEIPNVLVGNFPKEFLYIPKDILVKAIEYHQKYFAVLDGDGNVSTKFIIVQNGIEDSIGEIAKGNSRVLRARLSDASFFYEEDKKHDFGYWLDKLKGVIFYSGIGNMYDRMTRIKKISLNIASALKKSDLEEDLKKAAEICKCDLVTNMVVEFPELQGVVGREYALEKGIKEDIAKSVSEHYKPNFSGDSLPSTELSAILSIADKIDIISGMFLLGNIPTGSEDPFALRRKASGIAKSILEKKFDIDILKIVDYTVNLYTEKFDIDKSENIEEEIIDFILARHRFILEKQNKKLDIFDAITAAGDSSIYDISLKYDAVEDFIKNRDIESIANPMIRCKNIIKNKEISNVDKSFFKEKEETELFNACIKTEEKVKGLNKNKEYDKILMSLKDLGKVIDRFFDVVLVMDEDKKIRQNRVSLVEKAAGIYYYIADFSKIVIEG